MSKITIKQLMDLHGIEYDEWFEVGKNRYYISKEGKAYYKTSSGVPNDSGCDVLDLLLGDVKKFIPWVPAEDEPIWVVNIMDCTKPSPAKYSDLDYLEDFDLGLVFKHSDYDKAQARYDEVVEWLKKTKKVEME
jgi:hypothetical protein